MVLLVDVIKLLTDDIYQLYFISGHCKHDLLRRKWGLQAQLVASASKLTSSFLSGSTFDTVVMVSVKH